MGIASDRPDSSQIEGDSPEPEDPGDPASALCWLTAAVAAISLFSSLVSAGIWDPPELETAELARRIAHGLWGGGNLGAPGDPGVPTRGELGRGELPFLAIALGFRVFGLSTWAGRLPLAVFGVLGLLAVYCLASRLASRRAACLSVMALSTMPLYFVQSRTMLGEIVTMASGAVALAGLGLAAFEPRQSLRIRLGWSGLGVLGLFAGWLSRGMIVGVAVPALAVGLTWLVRALHGKSGERLAEIIGIVSLLAGALAAVSGSLAIALASPNVYSLLIGATTGDARPQPTFEIVIRDLGHAAFPWSAVIPAALGRHLTSTVSQALPEAEAERGQALVLLAVFGAGLSLIAQTALAPELGIFPFVAPAALALLLGSAFAEFERGGPSPLFGLVVGAFAILLLLDFRNFPEKGLVAFGVPEAAFPAEFARTGFVWLAVAGLGFSIPFFFVVQERASFTVDGGFRRADYLRWPRTLVRLWSGHLWFALVIFEVALLVFELVQGLSDRVLHWPALENIGEMPRLLARGGFLGGVALFLGPPLFVLARDLIRWLLELGPRLFAARQKSKAAVARRLLRRGTVAALIVSAAGLLLSLGYYPALMRQISPMRALETYRRLARPGEQLGLLGTNVAVARYEAGVSARQLSDPEQALDWLLSTSQRRFMALESIDLPSLNAGFRDRSVPRHNLPILESDSSQVLLAVNRPQPSEPNANPLAAFVLDAPPLPAHPLSVDLAGKLTILGWQIDDTQGHKVEAIRAGVAYDFSIYYRVEAKISGSWETFIHIEGSGRRYNGDHRTLSGKYPFGFWLPGDFIEDRERIRLEPNFTPGIYRVYFGLFAGDRRLEVRRGDNDNDRVIAGKLEVK